MAAICLAHVNLAHGFRGGERQTELLIRALYEQYQLQQFLVCREDSPLIEHLKDLPGLEIIKLKDKPDARLFGHKALGSRAIIMHAHEARAAQWVYLHSLFYKVPYIITRRVPEKIRDNALNRKINTKAAALVAISNAIAKGLQAQFNRTIEIIPSVNAGFTVNEAESANIKAQYADYFVVGQIGALVDRHKGQGTTLQAAALLKEKIPNLKLVFLGSGEDEASLQAKAQELGVDADFPGFKTNVADYIPAFDVFAFPSNYEGLGSVLLDVMAADVPVVAGNTGGIPDIVKDGVSGLLIEPGDAQALAAGILRLKEDESLRNRLTAGGRAMVKSHSPEVMAESYFRLYQSIIKIN
ncbi:MAG: glycosyltransferase family 4 protein [Proteobacteria bacterium]|uniref:Glycosyltransferase family 4 protein n=1 Tax=Candidatus Avisuccinivibrio stercorigallinarum TaxID=2840704 RepID=A0A9D9D9K1_9GAMM|nr:glycosyltransferase family 4 protein [Candidatus Avisuccinivibrio stercorigallinarum]